MSNTLSQQPPRNSSVKTTFGMWSALEKFVLSIMERFHFPEIGKVVQVFASEMEVTVEFPYRPALLMNSSSQSGNVVSKRLKVFSIFASNDEGICAPPNVGDWGICFFRAGDTNSGFFFGFHWGKINKVPKIHNTEMQPKWLVIKRNDSHILIDEHSDIELWHKNKNQVYISEGYETVVTPTNQNLQIQAWCNQHTPPTEFKLMTWIKTTDGKENETQVDGKTHTVQLHRRRITLWNMNESPCPYDSNLVTNSSAKISDLMYQSYTADGTYDVFDEVVQKTITTKDSRKKWYTGSIKKHTIKYKVGVGTSLLRPTFSSREDYEETWDFNWHKEDQVLALKETVINKSSVTYTDSVWFKTHQSFTQYTANEQKSFIEQLSRSGDQAIKTYKDAIAKFRYEIDECEQMAVTDDTVEKMYKFALEGGTLDLSLPYSSISGDAPLYPIDPDAPNPYIPGIGWSEQIGKEVAVAPVTPPVYTEPIISPVNPNPIGGEES